MRKILFLMSLCCMLCSSAAFASFPVNKKNVDKQEIVSQESDNLEIQEAIGANIYDASEDALSPAVATASDNNEMVILLLLWFFLGGFAAHRWYAKKPAGWNILFILTLGGLGVWWIIDLISIFNDDFM